VACVERMFEARASLVEAMVAEFLVDSKLIKQRYYQTGALFWTKDISRVNVALAPWTKQHPRHDQTINTPTKAARCVR
jgi:hypothetical protein